MATVIGLYNRDNNLGDVGLTEEQLAKVKATKQHSTFERDQVKEAVQVTRSGFGGSGEWHRSEGAWNVAPSAVWRYDRAVLIQSAANLASLLSRDWPVTLPKSLAESLVPGAFGENVFVDKLSNTEACVGDMIEAVRLGERTGLVLQITSPRRPCASVDQHHGKNYSPEGVRAHCARTGLAGIFARVLAEGTLKEGDVLRVVERPQPTWTMSRASKMLYGKSARTPQYEAKLEDFCGTAEELRELAGLEELAHLEWRGDALNILAQSESPTLAAGAKVALSAKESPYPIGSAAIAPGEEGTLEKVEPYKRSKKSVSTYLSTLTECGRFYRVRGPTGIVQWYRASELIVVKPPPGSGSACSMATGLIAAAMLAGACWTIARSQNKAGAKL